jgi:hypothetical protein
MELLTLAGGLGLPLDDSFIHLQFARNLAAGRGLSYNPGELVTGSTAPLWTALLALLAYLPGSPVAWAQLLGSVLYLATVDATWRLARELGLSRGLAALAGCLTLGTGWLAWSALSGMEVPLFALLSLWGIILHLRERGEVLAALRGGPAAAATTAGSAAVGGVMAPPLAAAVLALAALARPEGLLLLALSFADDCLLFTRAGPRAHEAHEAHAGTRADKAHAVNEADAHAIRAADDAHEIKAADEAHEIRAAHGAHEIRFADKPHEIKPAHEAHEIQAADEAEAGEIKPAAEGGPLVWHRPPFRRLVTGALLAVCVLAGPLLFYRVAGGSFLPTTFGAKGGHLRQWLPNLQYIDTVVAIFLRPQPFMTLLAGGGVAALVARLGSRRDRGLLPALWVVLLPLFYSTISPSGAKVLVGNFGRYYFPLFPVVILLGLLSLEGAAAALRPGRGERPEEIPEIMAARLRRTSVRVILVALLLAPTLLDLWAHVGLYTFNLANVEASDVRAARWLAPRLPAQAVLAVNDIGVFKFLLPNRVLDLAGIANPDLSGEVRSLVAGGMPFERAMAVAVARRRPDYIAIFPAWLPHLAALLDLQPLLRLRLEHNITMGADELVVYRTPWTRFELRRLPGDT